MTMNEGYVPVSCEVHSEYELAIIRGQSLNIHWRDEQDTQQCEILKPYDLITEQDREYLLATDSCGENKKIRLDKITEAHPD